MLRLRLLVVLPLFASLAACAGFPSALQTTESPQARLTEVAQGTTNARTNLLYVATDSGLSVYTYPKGKPIDSVSITGNPSAICSDEVGNVFVPATISGSGPSNVYEYAHGGTTPIATLYDPGAAAGCSVDKKSGNLAVANYADSDGSDIAVYLNASGSPALYPSSTRATSCSYDDAGNLFVGSTNGGSWQGLSELQKGGSGLTPVSLDQQIGGRNAEGQNVQWDGSYVAITDVELNQPVTVYRFQVSGSEGLLQSSTTLKAHGANQRASSALSWIQGKRIIIPGHHGELGFWHYPAGGRQWKHIFTNPIGLSATVSVATES